MEIPYKESIFGISPCQETPWPPAILAASMKMFHPNTDQQKDASGVQYMFKNTLFGIYDMSF